MRAARRTGRGRSNDAAVLRVPKEILAQTNVSTSSLLGTRETRVAPPHHACSRQTYPAEVTTLLFRGSPEGKPLPDARLYLNTGYLVEPRYWPEVNNSRNQVASLHHTRKLPHGQASVGRSRHLQRRSHLTMRVSCLQSPAGQSNDIAISEGLQTENLFQTNVYTLSTVGT